MTMLEAELQVVFNDGEQKEARAVAFKVHGALLVCGALKCDFALGLYDHYVFNGSLESPELWEKIARKLLVRVSVTWSSPNILIEMIDLNN